MSTRRLWLLAGLALATATLAGLWLLLAADPLEAARRRVPLGADEAAVCAALGRPPDTVMGKPGHPADMPPRALFWKFGDELLYVFFDEDGRAVKADRYSWWQPPTLWERCRALFGW
jgi:hypothetical protein